MTGIFEHFEAALIANPEATRKEAFDAFIDSVMGDTACVKALAAEYFRSRYENVRVRKSGDIYGVEFLTGADKRSKENAKLRERINMFRKIHKAA
ncbi:MAG: hypothetical protein WC026_16130 [Hyphomicrobium sp.]|uniref:hypothetical protein n=1 Tax=Hyphomicrobium sp. TaxID=82 RepID=UPI0035668EC3